MKTSKNNSCDQKGNFEIVPNKEFINIYRFFNNVGSQAEKHIQTREFEKSPRRGLERSLNFHSPFNRKKKIARMLRMKISKNSNPKGGEYILLLFTFFYL